ncbi:hypothetical protein D9M71_306350 [compost metagenome]
MGKADVEGGLADAVAVQHPFGAQLVVLAIAVELEGEAGILIAGAVVTLAVAVVEGPPAVRNAVPQALVVGMLPVVADHVLSSAQTELVGQAQRAVPVQTNARLLFAGAGIAVVVAAGRNAPGFVALALELHAAAADLRARDQFQLRLTRRQTIDLVDQLLQLAQVEHVAGRTREGHAQFTRRDD